MTTSGITHTCDRNVLGYCKEYMDLTTPRSFNWKSKKGSGRSGGEPIIECNYGVISIYKYPF